MQFQPTYLLVRRSHEKDTITAFILTDIITFFTYFKVLHQSLIHIQDKGDLAYQVKESHIHISLMHQELGLRSTKSRHTINHITHKMSFKYQVGTLSLPHKIPINTYRNTSFKGQHELTSHIHIQNHHKRNF